MYLTFVVSILMLYGPVSYLQTTFMHTTMAKDAGSKKPGNETRIRDRDKTHVEEAPPAAFNAPQHAILL